MTFTSCVGNLCVVVPDSLLVDLLGLSKVLLLELCVEELWSDNVSDLALGTEYGRTLFFPSNFCSQSSNTGDSEYVSELFFLGNVLLKVLEFDTAKIKRKKFH